MLSDESELREIRRAACAQKITVAAWVRQALRAARIQAPMSDAKRKLEVVGAAVRHSCPSGGIEPMIAEIERGYGMGLRCLRQDRLIWGQGRSRGLVRKRVCDDRETAVQCPESRNVPRAPKPGESHPGSEPARRETDGVLARQSQRQAAGCSSGLLPD